MLHRLKEFVNRTPSLQAGFNLTKQLVKLVPFYLVDERMVNSKAPHLQPRVEQERMEIKLFQPSDMKAMADHPEIGESEEELKQRLEDGGLCIGLRLDGALAACNWANLKRCDSRCLPFELSNDEAYLGYARTFMAYRGKNLAPYLRCKMYEQLQRIGRTRLYSITEYFNTPAIRFKKKLNVRPVKFGCWYRLAGKFENRIILKNYS